MSCPSPTSGPTQFPATAAKCAARRPTKMCCPRQTRGPPQSLATTPKCIARRPNKMCYPGPTRGLPQSPATMIKCVASKPTKMCWHHEAYTCVRKCRVDARSPFKLDARLGSGGCRGHPSWDWMLVYFGRAFGCHARHPAGNWPWEPFCLAGRWRLSFFSYHGDPWAA